MNKDFDLNLKADKSATEGPAPRITSVAYCTPGCITGELCGSSECGLTRNCTGSILCVLQRILFDAIICRIRKIKTSHF